MCIRCIAARPARTRAPSLELDVAPPWQLVRALRARIYQGNDEKLSASWQKRLSSHEVELSQAIPVSQACRAMQIVLQNHAPLPADTRIFVTVPLP